jgi:hypothetical protein
MYGALSDERTGLYFAVHITHWSESRRTRNCILLSHLRLTRPGGPGPRIHIPWIRGGPVKSPDTRLPPPRHHPRFAGLRWRYSNLPPNPGLRAEVTGIRNSDADTIESNNWVHEETPMLNINSQGNWFCTDSSTRFASVVAVTCPATRYCATEPHSATRRQWAIEKTPAKRSAPADPSATAPVTVTVCKPQTISPNPATGPAPSSHRRMPPSTVPHAARLVQKKS